MGVGTIYSGTGLLIPVPKIAEVDADRARLQFGDRGHCPLVMAFDDHLLYFFDDPDRMPRLGDLSRGMAQIQPPRLLFSSFDRVRCCTAR